MMSFIPHDTNGKNRGSVKHAIWRAGVWALALVFSGGLGAWGEGGEKGAEAADMVLIPGGTNSGTDPDFGEYSLAVESFWMDRTEVTLAQWRRVYDWAVAHGYDFDHEGDGKGENHPVHTVSWHDCAKWCNARSEMEGKSPIYTVDGAVYRSGQGIPTENFDRAGYRLPTGEEWEYAARGGEPGRRFPWGNTISHGAANYFASPWHVGDTNSTADYHPDYNDGTMPYTAPVASFPANGYGLHDMAGNVGEWTSRSFGGQWNCRGGGWGNIAGDCRSGLRYWTSPFCASGDVGFRSVWRARSTTNTPVAVAFEWLERYPEALEAHGGDHEAFAADTAANGRPVWECYVADLNPTDAEDELRVALAWDEENERWTPQILSGRKEERTYEFEGTERMPMKGEEGQWGGVEEGSRFFRVRVEMK